MKLIGHGVRYICTACSPFYQINWKIIELHKLLKEQSGRNYSGGEAHEAGLAIIRFVIAKEQRRRELIKQQKNDQPRLI